MDVGWTHDVRDTAIATNSVIVGVEIHPRPISEQMGILVVVITGWHSIKTDTPMSVIKRCLLVFDNHA